MSTQATITLNPQHIIGEVHDYLYGANLEHIGQSIYGGVWAEMLRDRKFAGNDHMYTDVSEGLHNVHPGIGVVVPWEAVNPDYEKVLFVHDNTTFYTGRQSQRITLRQSDGQAHGIQQAGLYVQAGHAYEVRVVLKGEGQTVTVSLGDGEWTIDAVANDWTTYEHTFTLNSTHPNGALQITISDTGNLWVGCASVMPSDHQKGFRADVIDALKDWTPTFLRWPGGNFVSAYHWQDGIGDRDKRPAYLDPAWWLWESHDVGMDEFIDLCRLVGSEPILTINMGDGTIEEAVAWVEYCNGDASTKFGAMRIANGQPDPYNVKVWFVGNEQFGNWQVGHVDAETYARMYLQFARAMREVDPTLTLIAVGVPTDVYGHWNELVLKIAGEDMDQFSVHYYSIRTEKWETPPPREMMFLPKIAAAHEVSQMLDDTLAIMDASSSKPIPIAFDEWNTYYGAKGPGYIDDYNLADALYTAGLMNACIQRCDRIKMSAIYNLINVMGSYLVYPLYEWEAVNLGRGGGWVPVSLGDSPVAPSVVKMPSTLVMELMTKYRGKHAVHCAVDSPTFSSPAIGNQPAFDAVPMIDASATLDRDTNTLYLALVNRDVKASIEVTLTGIDSPTSATIYTVTGKTPLSKNDASTPYEVVIQQEAIELAAGKITISPHTFMMLVIPIT
ncbi:MAG: alpha-L-arabinofuranosidase C-terminal domain-containing protein [Aggregatilineales bacterium]